MTLLSSVNDFLNKTKSMTNKLNTSYPKSTPTKNNYSTLTTNKNYNIMSLYQKTYVS